MSRKSVISIDSSPDENESDAPSLPGTAKIRVGTSSLETSVSGALWAPISNSSLAKGRTTATAIGVLITNTAAQNSAAIEAWLATLSSNTGGILEFDATATGEYYDFARTIALQAPVILRCGGAPGGRGTYSSYVRFPQNTTGVWIKSNLLTPPYGRGDNSRVEDLQIVGLGYSSATSGDGILIEGHGQVRDCQVQNFGGNGISIVAGVGVSTNANIWRVERCALTSNHGHGLFLDSSDANAGIAISVDCSSNDGYGFYDSSFLGNTFIGCHVDANILGSYKVDDVNARSLFLGCYVEGGQVLPDLGSSNSLWLGGLSEGGLLQGFSLIDGYWSALRIKAAGTGGAVSGLNNYLQFGSQPQESVQAYMRLWNEDSAGHQVGLIYTSAGRASGTVTFASAVAADNVTIGATTFVGTSGTVTTGAATYSITGGDNAAATSFASQVTAHATAGLYFATTRVNNVVTLKARFPGAAGNILALTSTNGTRLAVSGSGTLAGASTDGNYYEWYSPDSIVYQRIADPIYGVINGRAVPGAVTQFPSDVYLGSNKFRTGSTIPTTGTWIPGDKVLNSAPVAGGTEGWICVTAGTQGTYAHTRTATTNGGSIVQLSGTETVFKVGDYVIINSIAARITSVDPISGTSFTVNVGITAGSGLAIDYTAAVFKTFGSIAP